MSDKRLPLRCRFGFHAWSVWDAPVPGKRTVRYLIASLNAEQETEVQERRCLRCNVTELREAR